MNLFNNAKTKFQESGNLAQKLIEQYVIFNLKDKELILKKKTVKILCQQAELKVDKMISLSPDLE